MEVEKDLTMLKKALMKKKEDKEKEQKDNKTVTPEELEAVERAINVINWQDVEEYPQERIDVIQKVLRKFKDVKDIIPDEEK